MAAISFVVTSTPRSGTLYASRVLTASGLPCSHEYYFRPTVRFASDSAHSVFGDSSWLAAPFLDELPLGTLVVHAVRHPRPTMRSLVATSHLDFERLSTNSYVSFIGRHLPHLALIEDMEERVNCFWTEWHSIIASEARRRPYMRVQVEHFTAADVMAIGDAAGVRLDERRVELALADTPRDTNSRPPQQSCSAPLRMSAPAVRLSRLFGYENVDFRKLAQ